MLGETIFQVVILSGPDIYIHSGSPVHLECVVSQFVIPPMSVTWTHQHRVLDTSRYSGLSHKVDTNINLPSNLSMSDILTSFSSSLKIPLVSHSDAGNYSCRPRNFTPATIRLHVIDNRGEHRLPISNSGSVDLVNTKRMYFFMFVSAIGIL